MRVSKVVKDYIEESVNKAINSKEAEAVHKELNHRYLEAQKEINEAVCSLVERMIPEMMDKYQLDPLFPFVASNYVRNYNTVGYDLYNHPTSIAWREEEKENREARAKAIKDIILTLELGGTKADLDRMIAELGK